VLVYQQHPQVALRLFRNKTAAQVDRIGTNFDSSSKPKGPKDFLKRYGIRKVTPQMIAYAALQVFPTSWCISTLTLLFYRRMLGFHP
jgi:hypothetical protein